MFGTGIFAGGAFALAAMSILWKGMIKSGLIVLMLALCGTPIVYWLGFVLLVSMGK